MGGDIGKLQKQLEQIEKVQRLEKKRDALRKQQNELRAAPEKPVAAYDQAEPAAH
ncbi:hypothetical protein [Paenibacillus sp. N3.4]|uniref:hypothetical protein n=1 Tax=Paenibacillus sp. N3.4 TaxID=2603222 RepID=UPI001650BBE6|nr:hypothetical protein [Paenibacillus sp. N3.4]